MPDPYLSEIKFLGGASLDFVEIALDTGDDPSGIQVLIYNPDGTLRSDNDLIDVVDTQFGKDIYVLDTATSPTFNGLHKNGSVALVKDGVVLQYVAFSGGSATPATEGDAAGTPLTYIGNVSSIGESLEATGLDGSSYAVQTSPTGGSIPCFAAGTRIKTPSGARAVEALRPGDLVLTRDRGAMALRWIGQKTIDPVTAPELAPILLPRDCLGRNRPNRDLLVSPNHRILVGAGAGELLFAAPEVLIPAKHLVGHNGIRIAGTPDPVTYVHLLFDGHQIVTSNGLDSESLNPSEASLDAFGEQSRAEIIALFPDLVGTPHRFGQTPRPCLRRYETALALEMLAG